MIKKRPFHLIVMHALNSLIRCVVLGILRYSADHLEDNRKQLRFCGRFAKFDTQLSKVIRDVKEKKHKI